MESTRGDKKPPSQLFENLACPDEVETGAPGAALITMLDERLRSGSKAAEDDVRRQQVGSGMRGDKRRTYRFQDETVVDHATGKSMQASIIGHRGDAWHASRSA